MAAGFGLWLAGSLFLVASAQLPKEALISQHVRAGDQYLSDAQYEKALVEYEKVLKLNPDHFYARTQVKVLRRQLGIEDPPPEPETPKATVAPGIAPSAAGWPALPPRDYSKITTRLDPEVKSEKYGFSIRPPSGWWVERHSANYVFKFTDPNYEAFIFVDVIPVSGNLSVDEGFRRFVENQTNSLSQSIESFKPDYQNFANFQGKTAFETRATFVSGIVPVRMQVLYVPAEGRVFQITSVCEERLAPFWSQLFAVSLKTFTLTRP